MLVKNIVGFYPWLANPVSWRQFHHKIEKYAKKYYVNLFGMCISFWIYLVYWF